MFDLPAPSYLSNKPHIKKTPKGGRESLPFAGWSCSDVGGAMMEIVRIELDTFPETVLYHIKLPLSQWTLQ